MTGATLYANDIMAITGYGRCVRLRSVTKFGQLQAVNAYAPKTRVYDIRGDLLYADEQPYMDFAMPAFVGAYDDWKINPVLVENIKKWMEKNND